MTVNVHLNADAPNANDVPTLHNLTYMTLAEYCRVGGFDEEVIRETLALCEVTWGSPATETFLRASDVALACELHCVDSAGAVPAGISPDLFVFLG
jgi:hypothetical protein